MLSPEHIKVLCDHLAGVERVRVAYLFGSRAEGLATPESDWDIAVLARPPLRNNERHRLANELGTIVGAPVDLILIDRVPIELSWAIIATGRLLLERSVAERVELEAQVQSRYGDHLPVLRAQRGETIKGAGHEAGVRRYRAALAALGRLPPEARRPQGPAAD